MKRYLKYIFIALASAILAVSCLEELEPTPSMTANDEVAVLVPRIKSFANQYVTKSDYDEAELTLSSLKILVFNNEEKLVHHQDVPVDSRTISLNKSMLNSPENGDLTSATVVMLGNMDLARLKKGDTPLSNNLSTLQLDDLENYSYSHEQTVYTSLESGFKGFPMIGGTTDVDLSPTSTTSQQAPVVVDLKILYAKVNFIISVDKGGENERIDPSNAQQMQFQLDGYTVYNVSKATTLAIPTTEGEPVRDFLGNIPDAKDLAKTDEPTSSSDYAYPATGSGAHLDINKTTTLGSAPIPFTFYIAESRYNHNLSSLNGIYPDNEWLTPAQDQDVKDWSKLTDDQKKLPQNKLNGVKYIYDDFIQQYKPKLADVAGASPGKGLASYVLLTGKYTDYRGAVWDVKYKVYLGKDNSQNFHVDRNSEYTNLITIKGIRNDDSFGGEQVWLDHRVNVSLRSGQGADNCVTITRETLLDAHIEVRPLRIQWAGTTYDRVYAYLPTDAEGNLLNWVGIEKFTGDNCQDASTYCFNEEGSTGKRKYFTTNLINDLQNMTGELGVKVDDEGRKFLDCYNNYCLWVYFDENTATTEREAKIVLEFYNGDSKIATEEYTIRQRGLQRVGSYIVESYEEYLHSYDSADKYNLSTSPVDYTQQGLEWGLSDGQPLSEDIIVTAMPTLTTLFSQRYDYFHQSDVPQGDNYYTYTRRASGDWALLNPDAEDNFGTGLTFTDRAASKRSMTIRDMGSVPENAYQYCLSKNKFNEDADGNHTMNIHWYLPDVYELQNVLNANAANSTSADFGADAYYWSSQPSYTGRLMQNLAIINEVPDNARAVSKDVVSDLSRTSQNRIRCFYSEKGISVDMSQRVPDGLGGNFSFIMKGNPVSGYFNDLLAPNMEETPNHLTKDYEGAWYEYPTKDNSYGVEGAEFEFRVDKDKNGRDIEGFLVDPANQSNWTVYTSNYYTTLFNYPGLTAFTTEQYWSILGGYQNAYRPTTTRRSETQTYESSSTIVFSKEDLSMNSTLKPLNDKLKISFGPANSANNKPVFKYDELVDRTTSTNTRYWEPPVYNKKDYEMEGGEATLTESGTGTTEIQSTIGLLGGSRDQVRQRAFNGYLLTVGAYQKAKDDALAKLKDIINANYNGWNFNEDDVQYTTLTWESPEPDVTYTNESGGTLQTYRSTCTVKLTATVTITKDASLPLYELDSRTGGWGTPQNNTVSVGPIVNLDELRMYSGNSLTITCTDPNYEITKVKVVFSGKNEIDRENGGNIIIQTTTTYYARFVDSEIQLPQEGDQSSHLLGMEYDDINGWQQWSGVGRQAVTLILSDFVQTKDSSFIGEIFGSTWAAYDYEYSDVLRDPTWSFVVDRIEVKCSRKKASTE